MTTGKRKPPSKELQIKIFRRDHWLCRWCRRPVIFFPAMKYMQFALKNAGVDEPLAYYHLHGTRRDAPLLDELGACIDHVEAFSMGGACTEDNFCTACCKCNVRKSAAPLDRWNERAQRKPVKGKYGEPHHWDGFSHLFVLLANRNKSDLNVSDRAWLKVLSAAKQ
jgi:hypothetical protein